MSRRLVAVTKTSLGEPLAADQSGLDLVGLMIDGVHFGKRLRVVSRGIGIDGTTHPLGLAEGLAENTAVVPDLLTGPRDCGMDTTRPTFVGIDGGKALRAAVIRVFSHPVIARFQLHKIHNLADKPPGHIASTVTGGSARPTTRVRTGCEAQLEALATELDPPIPARPAACVIYPPASFRCSGWARHRRRPARCVRRTPPNR